MIKLHSSIIIRLHAINNNWCYRNLVVVISSYLTCWLLRWCYFIKRFTHIILRVCKKHSNGKMSVVTMVYVPSAANNSAVWESSASPLSVCDQNNKLSDYLSVTEYVLLHAISPAFDNYHVGFTSRVGAQVTKG